jgi:myo-inositol 2-dehydrogenase/D-chiro-inositol 1-dehydrogenase
MMSSDAPIRIGVIGVGRIGSMHAELLARQIPGAALAAVTDAVPEVARDVAARLGVSARPVDDLLSDPGIGAVAICSATDTHVDLMVSAAQAGKAIFCEKPVSLDLEEVDRGLAAVSAAGVPCMVGFNRRFDPAHHAVRDAVAAGEVGELHLVLISSRDPAPPSVAYLAVSGGIFLDMTIHDFDMARFLTGSEVVEVFAEGAVRIDPAIRDIGDLDTAVITLRHQDGCLTMIDNSRQAVYGYDQRVEVFGAKGLAASENPLSDTSMVRTVAGTRRPPLSHFFLERYTTSYIEEWRAFVDALRRGVDPPVTVADGRAALAIGIAAGRSVRERRPVRLSEVLTESAGLAEQGVAEAS